MVSKLVEAIGPTRLNIDMAYPVKPTHFPEYPYQTEWYERDFFHSPDGVKEFPQHHCKMSWVLSKPYVKQWRNAVDIGCRDGEYARYLQHHFEHTYCFDNRLRKRFPYNVAEGKTTHFHTALGKLYQLDDFAFDQVDYIKLDVDGAEWDIVQGAVKTIGEHLPVFCLEVEREPQRQAQQFLEETFGYQVVEVDERNMDRIMVAR